MQFGLLTYQRSTPFVPSQDLPASGSRNWQNPLTPKMQRLFLAALVLLAVLALATPSGNLSAATRASLREPVGCASARVSPVADLVKIGVSGWQRLPVLSARRLSKRRSRPVLAGSRPPLGQTRPCIARTCRNTLTASPMPAVRLSVALAPELVCGRERAAPLRAYPRLRGTVRCLSPVGPPREVLCCCRSE